MHRHDTGNQVSIILTGMGAAGRGARVKGEGMLRATSTKNKNPNDKFLVIQGGTLINPDGKPPIENATIIVKGEKIQTVSGRRDMPSPKKSRVIDAKGKT